MGVHGYVIGHGYVFASYLVPFGFLLIRRYDQWCSLGLESWYLDAGTGNRTPHCFLLLVKSQGGFTARFLVIVMFLQVYGGNLVHC